MSERPLGERRRRRLAERGLDGPPAPDEAAGPAPEPPSRPRPVVRPARTLGGGAATAPVLPTPQSRALGPLLAVGHRSADPTPVAEVRSADPAPVPEVRSADPAPVPQDDAAEPVAASGVGATLVVGSSRRSRRPLLVVAVLVVVVVVVVGALLALWLVDGDGDDAADPAVAPPGADVQQTLLLAVTDAQGQVRAAAVVAVGEDAVDQVLLPPNLLLTVADAGQGVPLEQAVALGPDSLERGVEDTLDVRVDSTLVLSSEQLSALVDGAGGVLLDVQEQVGSSVAVGPDQRLAGVQAVEYGTAAVEGQPLESRLSRFGDVLAALLAAVPADVAEVDELLAEAGADAAEPPVETPPAEVLADAAAVAGEGEVASVILPTSELAGDQEQALRGLDDDAAEAELSSRLAGARLPVSQLGEVQVVVRNGVGRSGLVAEARDRLVEAGLRYGGGGNAESFDVAETAVLVPEDTPEDRARGQAVADALGVGSLAVSELGSLDTDVVVILGTDFADSVAEEQQ